MTLRFLLDTNIISEPLRKKPNSHVVTRLADASGRMAIPSVVWHELVFGVQRLQPSHQRTYLERYLREVVAPSFEVLPYDQVAAALAWPRARAARGSWPDTELC